MAEFNQWHIEEIQLDLDSNTQGAIPIVYGRQGDKDGILCNIELTQQGVAVPQSWFDGKRVFFESRGNGISVRKEVEEIVDGVVKVVLPQTLFKNVGLVPENFLRVEDASSSAVVISGTTSFRVYVRQGNLDPYASEYYLEEIEAIVAEFSKWFKKIGNTVRSDAAATLTRKIVELENEKVEVTEYLSNNRKIDIQMSQKMTQVEFDSWVATLLDGGPSIFMDTLAALKTAYPNGSSGVALVRETDPAKIYVWNGTAWADYGNYAGPDIKKGSVRPSATSFLKLNTAKNMFDGNYLKAYIAGSNGYQSLSAKLGNVGVFEVLPNTSYSIAFSSGVDVHMKLATSTTSLNTGELFDSSVNVNIGGGIRENLVVTGPNDHYLYVNTTLPEMPAPKLKVVQSDIIVPIDDNEEYPIEPEGVSIYSKEEVELLAADVEKKYFHVEQKNLFDGNYIPGYYLAGSLPLILTQNENYNIIAVDVKPNTTYTILKDETLPVDGTYYFKVGTFSVPFNQIEVRTEANRYFSITSEHTSRHVFKTGANDHTLVLNVDKGASEPYVEILEGEYEEFQFSNYTDVVYTLNDNVRVRKEANEPTPNGIHLENNGDDIMIMYPFHSGNQIIYEYGRHVNTSIQLDVWRLKNIYYYDKLTDAQHAITSGDNEGVLRIEGEGDYLGGVHGDEIQKDLHIYVNGIEHTGTDLNGYFDSIEFVTATDLFHADTPNKAFTKVRSVLFDKTGVHIKTRWKPLGTFDLIHARSTILSIHKLTDSGDINLISSYRTNEDWLPQPVPEEGTSAPMPNSPNIDRIELIGGAITANIWNIKRGGNSNKGSIVDFGHRLKVYIDSYSEETVTPDDVLYDEHKFLITTL